MVWGVSAPGASVPCGGGAGAPPFARPGLIARVGPVRRRRRVLGGLAWYRLVPGEVPRRPWIRHVGVWWRQRLVVWVDRLSLAGSGTRGPFGVDVVAGGIQFLVRGGWLVQGGWPLVVGGVCGWSARWLPSHSLVLFMHGGLWPGGVGWWAVVVVGVVLRVWPLDLLSLFQSPLRGWGVGHRAQPLGLYYVVGRGAGLGARLDGDGG